MYSFTGIYNCCIAAEQPYEPVWDENTNQYEYNTYHNTPQRGMKKIALAGCIALIFSTTYLMAEPTPIIAPMAKSNYIQAAQD